MDSKKAINELKRSIEMPFASEISNETSKMAIEALEELQRYRYVGTVDECMAAREKQIPKEPLKRAVGGERLRRELLSCPICGKRLFDIAYLNGKKTTLQGRNQKFALIAGKP